MSLNVDYMEQELSLWCVGVTAIVRVILKDGSYHENIGFAEAKYASKGAAIQEAKMVCIGSYWSYVESSDARTSTITTAIWNLFFGLLWF